MSSPAGSGKDAARLLEEALRARAGGASPAGSTLTEGGQRRVATSPPLTLVQLILASLIAGLVVGILLAVLTLI